MLYRRFIFAMKPAVTVNPKEGRREADSLPYTSGFFYFAYVP